jgi:iron complex transport system ATP-binding protein
MKDKIVFDKVSISRNNTLLIQPFSATLGEGDFVILTGANGAGKSTLLKTLARLIAAGGGEILFNGVSLSKIGSEERSKNFAYSNSKKIEEEYIRIIDLVTLGRYPYLKVNTGKALERQLIDRYIGEMGISSIQHKFLNEISDGELQKAGIARALVQDTPVILMDEPSAFLDYPSKLQLFALLRKLALEENKIILCATHDVEMAAKYGTRFWHLENKSLSFSDKPIEWSSGQE